ncbi:acetylornithine transaminase [Salininema proteolyticum]|uniref:acetylornithine transaminase n=1 Tax=Salininema proteolyticum TaxID=1607685 RepID=UPI00362CA2C7
MKTRFEAALMGNYGLPAVPIASGSGVRVTDADGNVYLDMIGGIAVSTVGHGHPRYVEAIADQAAALAHTSNLYLHRGEVELAEKLLELVEARGKVFLCNSGTEANEAAVKLVLKAGKPYGRTKIVATENSFHGRSLGALAITGKAAIREPFAPFGVEAEFVPYGDARALAAAVDASTAAVFLEPTQGESGVHPATTDYLKAARRITSENGAALVLDEIQSGFGRTGAWFAHHAAAITPDVVTLAKGLAGGVPIGATIGVGKWGDVFGPGDHGSTFGGNPIACAAALAVIGVVEDEGLFENVLALGERLEANLADHPAVTEVRGKALWRGIGLAGADSAAVCDALAARGVLANPVRPDTIRIAPPLTITAEDVDLFCDILKDVLSTAPEGPNHE